jgi:hypothetical protein
LYESTDIGVAGSERVGLFDVPEGEVSFAEYGLKFCATEKDVRPGIRRPCLG